MIKSVIYLILGLFVLVGGFLELKRELSVNKTKHETKKISENEAKIELMKMIDNNRFFLLIGMALIIQLLFHFKNFEAMYFFEAFLTGMGIQSLFIILKKTDKEYLPYETIIVIIITLLLIFI